MTQVQGPPPGTTIVEDAPTTGPSTRGRGGDKAPRVKLGANRWFREIGWRHLVGVIAVVWALFPVSYLVSASLNPLKYSAARAWTMSHWARLVSCDSSTRIWSVRRSSLKRTQSPMPGCDSSCCVQAMRSSKSATPALRLAAV